MDIAALIAWIVTAGGGFVLLGTWLQHGGVRQQQTRTTRFPAPLVFGHFSLAAIGLVLWIIYLAAGSDALAWVSFGVLCGVALGGFTLFARWVPVYRSQPASVMSGPGAELSEPAEKHLPVPVVVLHGLLGATTLVLVLLAAAGVGGS